MENLIKLPASVNGIVIPSTINKNEGGEKSTRRATKKELCPVLYQAKTFFSTFGGYTISSQAGGWMDSDTNALIEETSQFIWAYSIADDKTTEYIIGLALSVKELLCQDNILVVINSIPYLV